MAYAPITSCKASCTAVSKIDAVYNLNVFYELYQYLGIGTTFKSIAFGLEFVFKGGVIFNDTVVNKSESFGRGIMGMSV